MTPARRPSGKSALLFALRQSWRTATPNMPQHMSERSRRDAGDGTLRTQSRPIPHFGPRAYYLLPLSPRIPFNDHRLSFSAECTAATAGSTGATRREGDPSRGAQAQADAAGGRPGGADAGGPAQEIVVPGQVRDNFWSLICPFPDFRSDYFEGIINKAEMIRWDLLINEKFQSISCWS